MPHARVVSNLMSDNLSSGCIIPQVFIDVSSKPLTGTECSHPGDANSSTLIELVTKEDIIVGEGSSRGIASKVVSDPEKQSLLVKPNLKLVFLSSYPSMSVPLAV